MCAPQTSPTGGRTGMEDGGNCPGFGFRARPINQETILQHCFGLIPGKLGSPLSTQPRGAHMPRNPMLPDCSQTRPTFKALILNECCFAGQIPQACFGTRRAQDVHLEARQAHSTIQAMRKQRENRTQWKRGSVSHYLSWLGCHCWPGEYESERCRISNPKQRLPASIYQKELFFFFFSRLHYFLIVCLV